MFNHKVLVNKYVKKKMTLKYYDHFLTVHSASNLSPTLVILLYYHQIYFLKTQKQNWCHSCLKAFSSPLLPVNDFFVWHVTTLCNLVPSWIYIISHHYNITHYDYNYSHTGPIKILQTHAGSSTPESMRFSSPTSLSSLTKVYSLLGLISSTPNKSKSLPSSFTLTSQHHFYIGTYLLCFYGSC